MFETTRERRPFEMRRHITVTPLLCPAQTGHFLLAVSWPLGLAKPACQIIKEPSVPPTYTRD